MNGSAQNPVLVPFDAENYYLINYPTSEVTTLPRYTNLFIIIIIIIRNAANRVLKYISHSSINHIPVLLASVVCLLGCRRDRVGRDGGGAGGKGARAA